MSRWFRALQAIGVVTVVTIVWIVRSSADAGSMGSTDANPFLGLDVVALFARTPGTVRDASVAGERVEYTSRRFGFFVDGRPEPGAAVSGRLADGSWVLLSPFESGPGRATDAMIYRAIPHGIAAIGALRSPIPGLRVSLRDGYIREDFPVSHPTGTCGTRGREIRTYDARGGRLRETGRRTDPPNFPVTLGDTLRRDANGALDLEQLAPRTKGLYRLCDDSFLPQPYLIGDTVDAGGMPYTPEALRFAEGPARLVALPFVSGGTGGVFDAVVYRVDTGHAIVVRTVHANGHLTMRAVRDTLEVASPTPSAEADCCFSHVDVTTYRYDPATGRLVAVGIRRREPTKVWMRGVRIVSPR